MELQKKHQNRGTDFPSSFAPLHTIKATYLHREIVYSHHILSEPKHALHQEIKMGKNNPFTMERTKIKKTKN